MRILLKIPNFTDAQMVLGLTNNLFVCNFFNNAVIANESNE